MFSRTEHLLESLNTIESCYFSKGNSENWSDHATLEMAKDVIRSAFIRNTSSLNLDPFDIGRAKLVINMVDQTIARNDKAFTEAVEELRFAINNGFTAVQEKRIFGGD